MPSVETNTQNFQTLLRIRTLCLGIMFLLLWWAENLRTVAAVRVGWELLIFAAFLGLLFMGLGRARRLSGILLPSLILVDSLLVASWVLVSGGAVSYYMPFFLLILISAIMILARRVALFVILGILAVFFAMLYLDYTLNLSTQYEAGQINFVAGVLEKIPSSMREGLYLQEAMRWFFFFLLTTVVGVLLMQQVWAREERVRVREKALEQKRHLIQMGELTGRIAHGVNTPLGLISGNLELLMSETRKGSKTLKQLHQIDQYVQRAIHTVRDILDFSRQSLSEIGPISISQVIQAVTASVQSKLKKKEGQLILDVGKNLPILKGYPEGLYQAILNLAENAVDSIKPGGIVTLSAQFQYRAMRLSPHDRRGEIKVAVRDTGQGIPPDELKRIFEPFYSTKGFGKGTGLGLAIVKRIVDEHQGEIKVESRVGEGTVFTLLFPTEGLTGEGAPPEGDFDYNEITKSAKEKTE